MKTVWQQQNDAMAYVFRHSMLARRSRRRAGRLTRRAVMLLRRVNAYHDGNTRADLERYLRGNLADPTMNPWTWLVLKVLLPIIIRLVLNWWFTELELERQVQRCDEGTD